MGVMPGVVVMMSGKAIPEIGHIPWSQGAHHLLESPVGLALVCDAAQLFL